MLLTRLDLHGLILADAMSRFVGSYNGLLGEGQSGELCGLQVIHGKGTADSKSVIRDELRSFLRREGTRIKGFDAALALRGADYLFNDCGKLAYMHGEDVDRNGGQTFVVPFARLRLPPEWRRY
jgi:hypothetical protein